MKLLPWLLLIIFAAAVYLLWPHPEDLSGFEQREKIRAEHIKSLQQDYEQEKRRRKYDSVAYVKTIQTYKDRDKKRVAEIDRIKANPVVIMVREEIPIIDSAFHAYDSLLQSKDIQIARAEKRIDKLEVDIEEVEGRFEEQLRLMGENVADLKAITDDQRKQLRKIRRQNRLVKVIAVVSAVVGFIGGSL